MSNSNEVAKTFYRLYHTTFPSNATLLRMYGGREYTPNLSIRNAWGLHDDANIEDLHRRGALRRAMLGLHIEENPDIYEVKS